MLSVTGFCPQTVVSAPFHVFVYVGILMPPESKLHRLLIDLSVAAKMYLTVCYKDRQQRMNARMCASTETPEQTREHAHVGTRRASVRPQTPSALEEPPVVNARDGAAV